MSEKITSTINAGGGILVDVVESVKKTAPKKATAKKPAKAAKKTAPKHESNGSAKLLNKPQTFILKVLAKARTGASYTRPVIAERAAKIGCATSRGRISDEAGNYGYLCDKGFIKFVETDVHGDGHTERTYSILANGRKALEKS